MRRSNVLGLLAVITTVCIIGLFHFTSYGVQITENYIFPTCSSSDNVLVSPDEVSVEEIYRYLRWSNSSSCILSHDFGGYLLKMGFVGYDGQKAICLDAGVKPEPGKCIIYSFGINNEWSFDDAMANYGCQVYAFDPSMNVATHNRSEKVHFFKMGLAAVDTEKDPSHGWTLKKLSSIYKMLKPWHGENAVIDYLKADVEMSEWDVIPDMIKSGMLDRIKQVGFEIHMFGLNTEDDYRKKYAILRSLELHGMVRFDSKGNPWLKQQVSFVPGGSARTGYEIAWYNPRFYQKEYV